MDFESYYRDFRAGFEARLAELSGGPLSLDPAPYEAAFPDPTLIPHVKMTALVLAAYRALGSNDQARAWVQEAFVEPRRAPMLATMTGILDAAPDGFRQVVEMSRHQEAVTYGPSFEFEREQDDDQAYRLAVRRCFFHEFFCAHGAPELTPVFCAYDRNWADAIDPARHGARFERPTTIGTGGDRCRFYFYRVPNATA